MSNIRLKALSGGSTTLTANDTSVDREVNIDDLDPSNRVLKSGDTMTGKLIQYDASVDGITIKSTNTDLGNFVKYFRISRNDDSLQSIIGCAGSNGITIRRYALDGTTIEARVDLQANGNVQGNNAIPSASSDFTPKSYVDSQDIGGTAQSWTSVSRVLGTTYTNTTGRSIQINVSLSHTGGATGKLYINGSIHASFDTQSSNGYISTCNGIIIPNGSTYLVNDSTNYSLDNWSELR